MADLSSLGACNDPIKRLKPRPLIEAQLPEEYPVDALSPIISNVVRETASYVKAPLALIAASALSAVSTAIQTRYSVQRDSALRGPAGLFLLTVAESGERKTTVDNLFIQPIHDWEAEQGERLRERRAEFKAALEDWERRGEDLQKNMASGFLSPQPGHADPRVLHQLERPEEPRRIRVLRGDDTPEAQAIALGDYPVASIISAEAGAIFGSHGMKGDAVMANLAQANQMWDGGRISQGRVSRDEVRVEGMRVTMGLQVQPEVLDRFMRDSKGLATGIGYLARFLFSRPASTQGSRYYDEAPAARPALSAFGRRMSELLAVEAEFDVYGRLRTEYVSLDADAHAAWAAFHDEVEEQTGADFLYSGIKGVASKAADNAARLACCLHVFGGGALAPVPPAPIGLSAMLGACSLMRWYLSEAVRFARAADAAPELADAQVLEEWLVAEVKKRGRTGADPVVSKNDVRRKGPSKLRQAHSRRLDDALELLADHHRVAILPRPGRKGTDIALRSEVLDEYSR